MLQPSKNQYNWSQWFINQTNSKKDPDTAECSKIFYLNVVPKKKMYQPNFPNYWGFMDMAHMVDCLPSKGKVQKLLDHKYISK
jgi:hypothetical protein